VRKNVKSAENKGELCVFVCFCVCLLLVENHSLEEWGAHGHAHGGGRAHIWGLRVAKERFLGGGMVLGVWVGGVRGVDVSGGMGVWVWGSGCGGQGGQGKRKHFGRGGYRDGKRGTR